MGSILTTSAVYNKYTCFKFCQYFWQSTAVMIEWSNPPTPSCTQPRSNNNKYYNIINNHLWSTYHMSDNYRFLSLEQPYDINITIWFCTWENYSLDTKDIIILRKVGTITIQFTCKISHLNHSTTLSFPFIPV